MVGRVRVGRPDGGSYLQRTQPPQIERLTSHRRHLEELNTAIMEENVDTPKTEHVDASTSARQLRSRSDGPES